jgi:cobalamin biosynthesis protein CobW
VEEVFEDQVACADLIVLSKSDLLDDAGDAGPTQRSGQHLPRAVKIVAVANGKHRCRRVLLGLGLAVEDDIENRKTHHDDERRSRARRFRLLRRRPSGDRNPEELARKVSQALPRLRTSCA